MYAVIETGGKQYRVEVGTILEVELLDAKAGDTVNLERVLLVGDGDTTAIGQPIVAEASVSAEVVRQMRGEKLISFKYRPKARRRVKKGHRQELHVLRIADIVLNGKSAAASVQKAQSDALTERQRLEEAAQRQAAIDAALAAKLAAAKTPKSEVVKATTADAKPKQARKPAAEAATETKKPPAAKAAPKKPTGSAKAAAKKPPAAKAAPKKPPATKAAAKQLPTAKPPTGSAKAAAKKPPAAKAAPKKPRATKKDE
jgi:large subunit ribosomal protein L21